MDWCPKRDCEIPCAACAERAELGLPLHTPDNLLRHREHIAHWLNKFPEVRWDRVAGNEDLVIVFGWVDRPDGKADVLVLEFTFTGDSFTGIRMVATSSAEHSRDFNTRIVGIPNAGDHNDCIRAELVFGDLLANAIRLSAGTAAEPESTVENTRSTDVD